jgi:hypothetical protein
MIQGTSMTFDIYFSIYLTACLADHRLISKWCCAAMMAMILCASIYAANYEGERRTA